MCQYLFMNETEWDELDKFIRYADKNKDIWLYKYIRKS
jgi:hypothetical protein